MFVWSPDVLSTCFPQEQTDVLSHLGYPHAAGTPALRELSAGKSQIGNLRSPGKQQDQASKGLRRKEAALALQIGSGRGQPFPCWLPAGASPTPRSPRSCLFRP